MTNQIKFNQIKEENFSRLEQFVPIVARVHGGSHPEFHEVKEVFDSLAVKIKEADSAKPELTSEFTQLRKITSNYSVPEDVCESYEAVYIMLSELDQAYHA